MTGKDSWNREENGREYEIDSRREEGDGARKKDAMLV